MKAVVGLLVVVLLILVVVDVVSTPNPPTQAACVLDRNLVLPDSCRGACDPLFGCPPASTRPYLWFFTQAASCPDLCVQLR